MNAPLAINWHQHYASMGYTPLPLIPCGATLSTDSKIKAANIGKIPGERKSDETWVGLVGWALRAPEPGDALKWHLMGSACGIRLGRQLDGVSFLNVIDVDVDDADQVEIIAGVVDGRAGPLCRRDGNPPRMSVVFVSTTLLDKIEVVVPRADGSAGKVELLSGRKQCVAQAIHPKSLKPFTWPRPLTPLSDLKRLSAEEIQGIFQEICSTFPGAHIKVAGTSAGGGEGGEGGAVVDQASLKGDPDQIRAWVRCTPNTTDIFNRAELVSYFYALKAATADYPGLGLELALDFAARWVDPLGEENDPDWIEGTFNGLSGPYRHGADHIEHMANRHGTAVVDKWFETTIVAPASPFADMFGPREVYVPPVRKPAVIFYGDAPPLPPAMLIGGILPQRQVAILAGVYGAGKTAAAAAVANSVMLGTPFAGNEVRRTGGVLWLAAEGQSEVDVRIKAALISAAPDEPERKLPFVRQATDVPTLTSRDALQLLLALAEEAKVGIASRFPGTELVLIVIDTLGSAAAFVDANSAAEAQRVMSTLRQVSDSTGALVLVVDHFGKMIETGVMGSSAKAQSADAILSIVSTRDQQGNQSDRRLSVYKLRNGPSGATFPFNLVSVVIPGLEGTTCAVEWIASEDQAAIGDRPNKPTWSGSDRLLKAAFDRVVIAHGKTVRPFGDEMPEEMAIPLQMLRREFIKSHPGESAEAKRKAFARALSKVTAAALLKSREIEGMDWVWLTG